MPAKFASVPLRDGDEKPKLSYIRCVAVYVCAHVLLCVMNSIVYKCDPARQHHRAGQSLVPLLKRMTRTLEFEYGRWQLFIDTPATMTRSAAAHRAHHASREERVRFDAEGRTFQFIRKCAPLKSSPYLLATRASAHWVFCCFINFHTRLHELKNC